MSASCARRRSGSVIVSGREDAQAAADVALQRGLAEQRQRHLAERQRVGVLADARSETGDQRHPLAAADERDDDLAGARGGEVDALVGAGEELVEHAVEAAGQPGRAAAGTRPAGLGGEVVGAVGGVDDEALLAERVEQAVGGRRALAERLGDLVGAHAVVAPREEREQRKHGARGADAAAAVRRSRRPAAVSVMFAPLLPDTPGRASGADPPASPAAGRDQCTTRRYIAATSPRVRRSAARPRHRQAAPGVGVVERGEQAAPGQRGRSRPTASAPTPTARRRPRR